MLESCEPTVRVVQGSALEEPVLRCVPIRGEHVAALSRGGPPVKAEEDPVEDEPNLDKRRASVGLPPISEYLKMVREMYIGKKP